MPITWPEYLDRLRRLNRIALMGCTDEQVQRVAAKLWKDEVYLT